VRLGYDGKGQTRACGQDDPAAIWASFGAPEGVLEAFVDFAMEISVITARGPDGGMASFVPVENRHRDHILARTVAPAPIPHSLAIEAQALAERIALELDLVGLLAVEMFVTRDGRLLVNELAPRPHNSGHWTIDACATSQFEQLVRAICGLPLGDPGRVADAVMDNILGRDVERWQDFLAEPGARLHLYGKGEMRPGRKLGHVTRLIR
jgi:5-(carboxyamino)imidazole ribonucleotide synthase